MSFLNGSAQGVPNVLKAVDPDLAFGAGMIPNLGAPTSVPTVMPPMGQQPGEPIDVSNVMQTMNAPILGQSPGLAHGDVAPAVQQARPRRSVLDIIGGVADTVARVGGADPLYQPNLDARTERARAEVNNDWEQKFNTQKLTRGDQQIEAGAMGIDDAEQARMGQAARGLAAVYAQSGDAGVARAWPMLAQQLNISDEDKALFSQALTDNPKEAIAALNSAMNDPQAAGTQPKEIQLYNMLAAKDQKLADDYLASIATGDKGLTAYQQEQLIRADRNFNLRQGRNQTDIDWRTDPRNPANAPKGGKGGKAGAESDGGAGLKAVLGDLRGNYENLRSGGAIVRQGGDPASNVIARVRASGAGQLVEGAVGTNAQTYRDNIKNSRPAVIQAIMAATGMSAKQLDSNAELKLALTQATDPTQSYETNQAALTRLERMVGGMASRPAAAAPPRQRTRRAPAPRTGGRPAAPASKPSVSNW